MVDENGDKINYKYNENLQIIEITYKKLINGNPAENTILYYYDDQGNLIDMKSIGDLAVVD